MFGKTTKKISDEHLMQLIINGDQLSFNELYRRYNDRLYYYFYRMLDSSEELANDFLQEIFLKIVEKPDRYNPSFPFSTWIFSVAHNMCKNEYRRREIRKQAQLDLPTSSGETVFQGEICKQSLIEQIYECLNSLKDEQRSAFLLFYREGFSINEIADILCLPKGTVKSRLHYTRKYLEARFYHLKDEVEL